MVMAAEVDHHTTNQVCHVRHHSHYNHGWLGSVVAGADRTEAVTSARAGAGWGERR